MFNDIVPFAEETDEESQKCAAEGLEKFLISRLHQKLFGIDEDDRLEDQRLRERICGLSWVSFEHLGVPPVDEQMLSLAVGQLRSVDTYKAPSDKLVVIMNAAKVINDVLKRSLDAGSGVRHLSADDFLPLLIFCVIKANPPRLHSNVEFVATFRHPSRLNGEDAYFLTALQSAIAFVRESSAKVFEVSEEDYRRLCSESRTAAHEGMQSSPEGDGSRPSPSASPEAKDDENNDEEDEEAENSTSSGPRGARPPTSLEMKAASLGEEERRTLADKVQSLNWSYEATLAARDLRVSAIPGLLREYKEMATLLRQVEKGLLLCNKDGKDDKDVVCSGSAKGEGPPLVS